MDPTFWEVFGWAFAGMAGAGIALAVPVLIVFLLCTGVIKAVLERVIAKLESKLNE